MAALRQFSQDKESCDMEIRTVQIGALEKARVARLEVRLKGLQEAVVQAAAEAGTAEAALPELEQAANDAEQLVTATRETTAEHMIAAGLGPKSAMAGNPQAREREFQFRLGQSEVVMMAEQQKQQATQNLKQAKGEVARLQNALYTALADLERFTTSFIEGGIK